MKSPNSQKYQRCNTGVTIGPYTWGRDRIERGSLFDFIRSIVGKWTLKNEVLTLTGNIQALNGRAQQLIKALVDGDASRVSQLIHITNDIDMGSKNVRENVYRAFEIACFESPLTAKALLEGWPSILENPNSGLLLRSLASRGETQLAVAMGRASAKLLIGEDVVCSPVYSALLGKQEETALALTQILLESSNPECRIYLHSLQQVLLPDARASVFHKIRDSLERAESEPSSAVESTENTDDRRFSKRYSESRARQREMRRG